LATGFFCARVQSRSAEELLKNNWETGGIWPEVAGMLLPAVSKCHNGNRRMFYESNHE